MVPVGRPERSQAWADRPGNCSRRRTEALCTPEKANTDIYIYIYIYCVQICISYVMYILHVRYSNC